MILPCPPRIRDVLALMLLATGSSDLKWYAFALNQFDMVGTKMIPTMALTIDRATITPRIMINPDFIEPLSDGEIIAVLMHELWHFLNATFSRQELRDEEKWNFATDAVINHHVDNDIKNLHARGDAIKLPGKIIRLPAEINKQEDIFSEGIYERIPENKDDPKSKTGIGKLWGQFQAGDITLVDDHSLMGGFDDVPEDCLKNSIANVIKESSRMAGTCPGGADDILKHLYESKVPWRTLLRNFTGQHLKIGTRPSWKRPNRRFPGFQPGKQVKRSGKVVILVDTSGSTAGDLPQFFGEVNQIAKQFETWVIQCDAQVQGKPEKFVPNRLPKVKGFGGTDMNPGLQECMKMKADIIIVFTDGYLSTHNLVETGKPELWIICSQGQVVPGRKCIKIEE